VQWPDDSDGDVFRRLQTSGFDFAASHTVDYNVDFSSWPPAPEAMAELAEMFESVTVYEPDDESEGYVLVREHAKVTYQRVIQVQKEVSNAMSRFGGICESWGILH